MKIKKALCALVALSMTATNAVGLLPAAQVSNFVTTVKAWSESDVQTTADGLKYVYDDDGIVIVGATDGKTSVTIPDEIDGTAVYRIDSNAFEGQKKLSSIDLGSVTTIGERVFRDCTSLKTVTIPNTVKETGEYWAGCLEGSSVEKVIFEEGITSIPAYVCLNASSVKEVVIPESPDVMEEYSIGSSAFEGTGITSVELPASITNIGDSAFKDCAYLTSFKVPEKVGYVGSECFAGCKRLTSLDLGNAAKLGHSLLKNSASIKEIVIPKSVKETGEYWAGCLEGSSVEKVIFEEGITSIPAYVCLNASSVKEVVIPESPDAMEEYSIGSSAFEGTGITSVELPASITNIGDSAFKDCAYLTSFKVPEKVGYVGSECFAGCKRLTSLDLGNAAKLGHSLLKNSASIKEIVIPNTVKETGEYWAGCLEGSSVEKVIFEEGITSIPAYVCLNASSVKEVVIPESPDAMEEYSIGDSAFEGTGITSVELPASITNIGDSAFKDCAYLTSFKVPEKVGYVGSECFAGCKRLTSLDLGNAAKLGHSLLKNSASIKEIVIPNTVKETGEYWAGCLEGSSVEKVIFEEGITSIPAYVCLNASSVKEVVIPESPDAMEDYSIGTSAFQGTGITSVELPASITNIGDNAFKDCAYLTSFKVPEKVGYVGSECFAGCKRLTSLDLGNAAKLGHSLLKNSASIKEIVIPNTVKETGEYWAGCLEGSSVEKVIFEEGLTEVPDNIALNCTSLKTAVLPDSCNSIGDHAFEGCTSLEVVRSSRRSLAFKPDSFTGCKKLDDARFRLLDPASSYLVVNSDKTTKNGIVNMTLKYKLPDEIKRSADDVELVLDIPEGLSLLTNSVNSSFELDADELLVNNSISTDAKEGEIRFSVRVNEPNEYDVSANLKFRYNNARWDQKIGAVTVRCDGLTIAAPENVNAPSVDVYGFAERGSDVKIFINGSEAGTVTANSYTGKYSGNIPIAKAVDGTEYELYAVSDGQTSDTIKVKYSVSKPVVTDVKFFCNAHDKNADEYDITDVFTKGKQPVISFNPAFPMRFEIDATNSERIERMAVTSTKAGITKYIEAKYDPSIEKWVADGYFDEYNTSYVPGALNITVKEVEDKEITEKDDAQKFTDVPDAVMENSSVDVIAQDDNTSLAKLELSNGVDSLESYIFTSSGNDGTYIDGKYVSKDKISENTLKYGFVDTSYHTFENGVKYDYYMKIPDASDIKLDILERTDNTISDINSYFTAGGWGGGVILKVMAGNDGKAGYAVDMINTFATDYSIDTLESIYGKGFASPYTKVSTGLSVLSDSFHYAYMLKKYEGDTQKEAFATASFALRMAGTVSSLSVPFPAGTLMSIGFSLLADMLEDEFLGEPMFGESGHMKLIIDPSGVIYGDDPDHPIAGATVTIYYRDPETGEAVKWNAEDYDQVNPIITGDDGVYLWDVPEGEWRVTAEKEGYELYTTDWMEIPPVRTDVNIPLVSVDVGIKGDANGDGKINVTDVAKVAAQVKGIKPLDAGALKRADVNGDGRINVTDVSKIAAHVKGIRPLS